MRMDGIEEGSAAQYPFGELFFNLSQDLTREDLKEVKSLVLDKLGGRAQDVTDWASLFTVLVDEYKDSWVDLFGLLESVFEYKKTHVYHGLLKLADSVRDHRKNHEEERQRKLEFQITKDKNFVGRTAEMKEIQKFFNSHTGGIKQRMKGVCICGMAGMGKTTLASEICYSAKDKCVKRSLKGVKDMSGLYTEILHGVAQLRGDAGAQYWNSNTQSESALQQAVFEEIQQLQQDVILFLDNVDEILDKRNTDVINVMTELLSIQTEKRVRMILTTRQKFTEKDDTPSNSVFTTHCGGNLKQVELKCLDISDAKQLLWLHAGKEKLNNEDCREIADLCGRSPLMIKIIGSNLCHLNANDLKTTLEGKDGISDVEKCLDEMFQALPAHCQKELLHLSVFERTFTSAMAKGVLRYSEVQLKPALNELINRSLLDQETEDEGQYAESEDEMSDDDLDLGSFKKIRKSHEGLGQTKKDQSYSFHPLILGYLKQKSSEEEFLHFKDQAEARFYDFFLKYIGEKISKDLDKHSNSAFAYITLHSVHLSRFFRLMHEKKCKLRIDSAKDVRSTFFLFKVRSFVGNHYEQLNFYQELGKMMEQEPVVDEMFLFYIRIQELIQHRMVQNQISIKAVTAKLKTMFDNFLPDEGSPLRNLALADYYSVMGRAALDDAKLLPVTEKQILENAREHFREALQYYKSEKYARPEMAQMTNCIGCAYYQLKEYKEAKKYHKEARKHLQECVPKGLHSDMPNIVVNIGTVNHALATEAQQGTERAKELYEKALKYYSMAEDLDKKLGFPDETQEARRLRNRADIHRRLDEYPKAAACARRSFDLFRRHFAPPHKEITLSLHGMGYIERCRGDFEKAKAGNVLSEEAEKGYERAKYFYKHVRRMVETGGLHKKHQEYPRVRENHEAVVAALGLEKLLQKTRQFYREFEAGRFDGTIKKIQRDMEGQSSGDEQRSSGEDRDEPHEDYSDVDEDEEVGEDWPEAGEAEPEEVGGAEGGDVEPHHPFSRLDSGYDADEDFVEEEDLYPEAPVFLGN